MSKLVLDANVVVYACKSADGFEGLGDAKLLAPPLMWSEARASIRETLWRGEIAERTAVETLQARRILSGQTQQPRRPA